MAVSSFRPRLLKVSDDVVGGGAGDAWRYKFSGTVTAEELFMIVSGEDHGGDRGVEVKGMERLKGDGFSGLRNENQDVVRFYKRGKTCIDSCTCTAGIRGVAYLDVTILM